MKAELQNEKDEKVDLVTEKVRSEEIWAKSKAELMEEISKLKSEVENSAKLVESSSHINRKFPLVLQLHRDTDWPQVCGAFSLESPAHVPPVLI